MSHCSTKHELLCAVVEPVAVDVAEQAALLLIEAQEVGIVRALQVLRKHEGCVCCFGGVCWVCKRVGAMGAKRLKLRSRAVQRDPIWGLGRSSVCSGRLCVAKMRKRRLCGISVPPLRLILDP